MNRSINSRGYDISHCELLFFIVSMKYQGDHLQTRVVDATVPPDELVAFGAITRHPDS